MDEQGASTTTMLDAALKYRELGWSVIPIRTDGDKVPHVKWKQYQTVLPTEQEIRQWWKQWPKANIGVITGKLSGVFSVDFDSEEAIRMWEAKFGELPPGLSFFTSRGMQCPMIYHDKVANKGGILPKVDIRGEGGYFVAPPSVHASGKVYTWGNVDPLVFGLDELAECPRAMLKFIIETPAMGGGDRAVEVQRDATGRIIKGEAYFENLLLNGSDEGKRNEEATSLCGWMVGKRAKEDVKRDQMFDSIFPSMVTWDSRNRPPLGQKEIETICKSIINRHSFDNISQIIGGRGIYNMEIIYRQAQRPLYKIYSAEGDQSFTCNMEDLCSLPKFRAMYGDLTQHVIGTIKPAVWLEHIGACVTEATKIYEQIDQSPVSVLGSYIIEWGDRNKDRVELITRNPVLLDNSYYVTLNVAAQQLIGAGFVTGTGYEEARQWLKALGFSCKGNNILDAGKDETGRRKKVRTWKAPAEEFLKKMQPF